MSRFPLLGIEPNSIKMLEYKIHIFQICIDQILSSVANVINLFLKEI